MGLQTLADFETKLQFALGNRGFDPSELQYWINVGLEDLVGTQQFESLIEPLAGSVAANTNVLAVTLPDPAGDTPLEGIIEISDTTNDHLITKIDKARYNLFEPGVTGFPKHWYREGLTILVWPWPTAVTNFVGQVLTPHPQLVDPTDTTILLRAYDRAIHLLAMFHALTDLEEPNRAAYFLQASSRYVDRVTSIDDIEGRATSMPLQPIETAAQLHRQRFTSLPDG